MHNILAGASWNTRDGTKSRDTEDIEVLIIKLEILPARKTTAYQTFDDDLTPV